MPAGYFTQYQTSMLSKTIAVIGGGTAGLTAAVGLAKAGYPVILVEKSFLGGDCTNWGCVPSKALLHQGRQVAALRSCLENLNKADEAQVQALVQERAQQALKEVRAIRQEFREHESRQWLEEQGVGLVQASAVFTGKRSLQLSDIAYVSSWIEQEHAELREDQFLFFDRAIIATGSRPAIPGIFGLEQVAYYTNETIFEIEEIPEHLLILGSGPEGVELANAFINLGSRVTVIGQTETILKGKVDIEVAERLQELLQQRGINFAKGRVTAVRQEGSEISLTTEAGSTFRGTKLLIAAGRLPNTNLGLEKAEVRYNEKGIQINKYSQTTTDNIFALGDCCPVPRFTHFAYYQAKKLVAYLAIRHITKLPFQLSSFRRKRIPAVIYTDVEVAQYGYTEQKARRKWGDRVEVHYLKFDEVDRARVEGGEPGMIKLITKGPLARMVGVSMLASRAGEMLPEFQRLIAGRTAITALDEIIRAYPSYTSNLDTLYTDWLLNKLPMIGTDD